MAKEIVIYKQKELEKIFNENLLNITDCDTLIFREYEFDEDLIIKCIFYEYHEDVKKDQVPFSLIFDNCIFKKDLVIDLEIDKDFHFNKISIINTSKDRSIKNLKLGEFNIDKLYLKNYTIENLNLFNLDFNKDSKILFENIITNKLSIRKISQNSKYIQFHNVKVKKKLFTERVEFKNTYFNDFDLEKASIKLIKTSFRDAHLNSVHWGKELSRIKAKKDVFRQLKYVNDQSSNFIDGNRFFEQEMRVHQNDIRKDKSKLLEKFTLCLNKNMSDFGQNWFLPLMWIIIISFSMMIIQKGSSSDISFIDKNLLTSFIVFILFIVLKNINKNFTYSLVPLNIIILSFILMSFIFDKSLGDLIQLISIKPTEKYQAYWGIHKLLVAFPLYHFTISLRRLTRR